MDILLQPLQDKNVIISASVEELKLTFTDFLTTGSLYSDLQLKLVYLVEIPWLIL